MICAKLMLGFLAISDQKKYLILYGLIMSLNFKKAIFLGAFRFYDGLFKIEWCLFKLNKKSCAILLVDCINE